MEVLKSYESLPPAPQEHLRVEVHNGLVTFLDHENRPVIANCHFGLEFADGTKFTTEGITPTEVALEDGTKVLRYAGDEYRPGFNTYYRSDGKATEMWLGIDDTTDRELKVKNFIVLESPEGYRNTPVDQVMHSQMGYQAQGRIYRPRLIKDQEFQPYSDRRPECQLGPMPDPDVGYNSIAPWMTRIQTPDGEMMLIGSLKAHKYKSHLEFNASNTIGHRFTAINNGEKIPLKKDEENLTEPLLIMTGTIEQEHEMLLHYRDRVAEENNAKPLRENIKGWGSWYREYPPTPNITEKVILRNADAAAELIEELGLKFFQIDDGIQVAIGDWDANDKFPSGHQFIAKYIQEKGFIAGDWVVPYVADNTSWVFQNHPEWFIKDAEGNPKAIKYHGGWEVFLYALDPTIKAAAEWMNGEFRKKRDAGYEYSKTDFDYLIAEEEDEANNPTKTGTERLRLGLGMTAEAYDNAELLGCQIPFLMAVGLVGANRVGHDIKPVWDEGIPHNHSALKYAVMAVQELWWMNVEPDTGKGWWQNDPDCIIARMHNFDLTDAERETWLSTVLLANGVFKLSDDLTELEPKGLEMIKKIFKLQKQLDGMTARPMGPYTHEGLSELMLLPRPNREGVLFGSLSNWDDVPKNLMFEPKRWGIPDGKWAIVSDQWSGQTWRTKGPILLPPTEPHGTRLLTVQAA